MSTEEDKNIEDREDKLRRDFIQLVKTSPNDAAAVFLTLRRRLRKFRDLQDDYNGELIGQLAKELDLNALQTGRLQAMVRTTNERLKEAIRKVDADSPALHPLDRTDE
jgi:hypothetical protein